MRLTTTQRIWTLAVVQLIAQVALALVVLTLWLTARETHQSLCELRNDVHRRLALNLDYRQDVRSGRRELLEGLTMDDLNRSIKNLESTVAALSDLSCAAIPDVLPEP